MLKFNLPLKQVFLIMFLLVIVIFSGITCFNMFLAERNYREAFYASTRSLKIPRYFDRYVYALEYYDEAAELFPFEMHYNVMQGRDIEKFINRIKDPNKKIELTQKAIRLYEDIQHIDDINPWYFSRLSMLYTRLGILSREYAPDQAKEYYQKAFLNAHKAAQIDFENPIFLSNYGNLLVQSRKFTEALYYFKKSVHIDDRLFDIHFQLGKLYSSLGYFDLATDHFLTTKEYVFKNLERNTRLTQKAQAYKNINNYILKALIQDKKFDKAVMYFEQHLSDKYNDHDIYSLGGYIYHLTNQYRESYNYFDFYYQTGENPIYISIYVQTMKGLVQANVLDANQVIPKIEQLLLIPNLSDKLITYLNQSLDSFK